MGSGTGVRQAAADELADRLKQLADHLAANGARPKRVLYGRGGAGLIKRRSPSGFVLEPTAPQLLLPDGRLWYFHTRLNPAGIYYAADVDHTRSQHGPIPVGDLRFSFLGAVVRKYSFGYRHSGDEDYELGAVIDSGGSLQFVAAADAFAEIVKAL